MRVCMNYLAKRWHSVLAFVACISFRFRPMRTSITSESRSRRMLTNESPSSSLPRCIFHCVCVSTRKSVKSLRIRMYWVRNSARRACGCLSTAKMVDSIDITGTNIRRAVKKPEDWLKKTRKRNCVKR